MGESTQPGLVVVANRLPVDKVTNADGETQWQRSPGGLVTALEPVVGQRGGTWVGWAGSTDTAPAPFDLDGLHIHPVQLSDIDLRDYYEGFSNATLWPLYHDAAAAPSYHRRWWDRYVDVNRRFADATAEVAPDGATVWVQDYQLQLVPQLLREKRPDLRIGFFLHIPFPPVELFMQLPWRTQIVDGLLGADLLGFQRPEAASNFLRLTRYLSGLETRRDAVLLTDRVVRVDAFPISIDFAALDTLASSEKTLARAREIRREIGAEKILLGVDRLDYIKGISQRLKAFNELLGDGLISAANTALVQVATPSRERVEHYKTLRRSIESQVGRIDGEFGSVGHAPVQYLRHSYDAAELAALYRAADVMLVTPLRDGMNLVAKEYVAARGDLGGALVLSEFTGAAAELTGAFLINPYDVDGTKNAIMAALSADAEDKAERMSVMRKHVAGYDVATWAREFLETLTEPPNVRPLPPLLKRAAAEPGNVLVISDYDGVLAPFVENPETATPVQGTRTALLALARVSHTDVVILTGRSVSTVRSLIGITAEDPIYCVGLHGFDLDERLGEPLTLTPEQQSLHEHLQRNVEEVCRAIGVPFAWLPDEITSPKVVLEKKVTSVGVHVRTLDERVGRRVLSAIAEGPGTLPGVTVRPGAMVCELAVTSVNKGDGMRLAQQRFSPDRSVFLGDDATDLDAFSQLGTKDIPVTVGERLLELVAANRRHTITTETHPTVTPAAAAAVDRAVKLRDAYDTVEALTSLARARSC